MEPTMHAPAPNNEPSEPRKSGWARRLAAVFFVSILIFGVLWYTVFTAVTAALVAAGLTGVVVVGNSSSDAFETILGMLAHMFFGIFAAIFSVVASFFSLLS